MKIVFVQQQNELDSESVVNKILNWKGYYDTK